MIAAMVVGTSIGAQAQWVNYPTPGLARGKDGKPNTEDDVWQ